MFSRPLQRGRFSSAIHRQRALAFGRLRRATIAAGGMAYSACSVRHPALWRRRSAARRFVAGGGRFALGALSKASAGDGSRQQAAALAEGGQQLIELVAAQGRGAFFVRAQRDRRLLAVGGGAASSWAKADDSWLSSSADVSSAVPPASPGKAEPGRRSDSWVDILVHCVERTHPSVFDPVCSLLLLRRQSAGMQGLESVQPLLFVLPLLHRMIHFLPHRSCWRCWSMACSSVPINCW